jgi:hypothetical protein
VIACFNLWNLSRIQEWRRNIMLQRISNFVQGECKRFARFAAALLVAVSLGGSFAPTFAQQPGQQTFAHALFVAMQSQDEESPLSVLGPAAKEVLSSGDPTEDADARVGFVVRY